MQLVPIYGRLEYSDCGIIHRESGLVVLACVTFPFLLGHDVDLRSAGCGTAD
jgi:hypothetical protein